MSHNPLSGEVTLNDNPPKPVINFYQVGAAFFESIYRRPEEVYKIFK